MVRMGGSQRRRRRPPVSGRARVRANIGLCLRSRVESVSGIAIEESHPLDDCSSVISGNIRQRSAIGLVSPIKENRMNCCLQIR